MSPSQHIFINLFLMHYKTVMKIFKSRSFAVREKNAGDCQQSFLSLHMAAQLYTLTLKKLSKNYKIDGPWLKNDIKLPMFLCLRKFGT